MTKTISKLASELNVNVETIRYYERKGIITQPAKPLHGYRHYPDSITKRIRFIKRAQEIGFTLDEIADLLSLNEQPCSHVQSLASQKLQTLEQKINDLQLLHHSLQFLIRQCQANEDWDSCPIISSLQPD